MYRKHRFAGALVCALLLVAAPAAIAQTSAQTGYSSPAGEVQQQLGQSPEPARSHTAAAKSNDGGLPFTGLDVGLVGAAGAILLAAGFAARRLGRTTTR
jgi:hypothetical protein